MKLIFCKVCEDVVRLDRKERTCECQSCGGRYLSPVLAEYWGESAVPLSIDTESLKMAVSQRPENGRGNEFVAFVIPHQCPTYKRIISERKS